LAIGLASAGWCADGPPDRPLAAAAEPVQLFEPLAGEAPAGNAGVFVGIGRFDNDQGLATLQFAAHDAIELAYLFTFELKLIPPRNCHLLLAGEPSAEPVRVHLEQLRRAGANVSGADRSRILLTLRQARDIAQRDENLLICSLSSHGFDDRGEAYVMPSDGVRELIVETAAPLKAIETMMQESRAGHRLLLVDACQERISAKSVGTAAAGSPQSAAFAAALQAPSGQAKLASCSPGEFSFEHAALGGVGQGLFTHQFLQALRGGARADEQNIVRLGDVADYVANGVTGWTTANRRPKQTPFLQSPLETRRLPLAVKADDLATLIAAVEKHPLSPQFTQDLRTTLVAHLRTVSAVDGPDRELLQATRSFTTGQLSAAIYAAFLREDQSRWSTATAMRKPATTAALPPAEISPRNYVLQGCSHGEECVELAEFKGGLFSVRLSALLSSTRPRGAELELLPWPSAAQLDLLKLFETLQAETSHLARTKFSIQQLPTFRGDATLAQAVRLGTKRAAVIVGVDRNADPAYPRLNYAVSDAQGLAAVLRKHEFEVQLLTSEDGAPLPATKAGILAALQRAASQQPDLLWVHFSGNGFADPQSQMQTLLPADGRRANPNSLLTLPELEAAASRPGTTAILSIDACRKVLPADKSTPPPTTGASRVSPPSTPPPSVQPSPSQPKAPEDLQAIRKRLEALRDGR